MEQSIKIIDKLFIVPITCTVSKAEKLKKFLKKYDSEKLFTKVPQVLKKFINGKNIEELPIIDNLSFDEMWDFVAIDKGDKTVVRNLENDKVQEPKLSPKMVRNDGLLRVTKKHF